MTIPTKIVDRAIARSATVFIETGYHGGSTVEQIKDRFERVYSIELAKGLYQQGIERHASDKIRIIHGDSAEKLGPILAEIQPAKALIWLDAHWSHGMSEAKISDTIHTPILGELAALQAAQDKHHILVIDDLADFQGTHGYPTVTDLVQLVYHINPHYNIQTLTERRGVLEATT